MPKSGNYNNTLLLLRQLRQHGIREIPEEWKTFIAAVNETYNDTDKDRGMLERALELTSVEMLEIYEKLKQDTEQRLKAESELHTARENMLAAKKHEELGRLAQNVAHDFNNLLAIIGSHAQKLEQEPGALVQSVSAEIWLAVERGRDVAKQILAFSKQEKMILHPYELNALLQKYKQLIQASLGPRATLHMETGPNKIFIDIDEGHFARILLNLAFNARDAMGGEGSFSIGISVKSLNDSAIENISPNILNLPGLDTIRRSNLFGSDFVFLTFTDNGSGIPGNVLQRIFEPYFTTKDPGRGTGLGLAMAYSVIKQFGGFLFCSTGKNQGTTFHILLPLVPESAVRSNEIPTPGEQNNAGNESIVVLDDERTIRDSIAILLRQQNFKVVTMDRGRGVLDFLENQAAPALIICDANLTGESGCDIARQARDILPGVKILMMSGGNIPGEDSRERGSAFPILEKPFSRKALIQKVYEVLGRS